MRIDVMMKKKKKKKTQMYREKGTRPGAGVMIVCAWIEGLCKPMFK